MSVPKDVRAAIFRAAGKDTSPIPVRGTINGHPFQQSLVRYAGAWRLYLNQPMREGAEADVGDTARFELAFDTKPREYPIPPALAKALAKNRAAKKAFEALTPGRQKEITRYVAGLKTAEARERTIAKVLRQLAPAG